MNIKIGNCSVGDGQPVFIVAEMSGNHGGDLNRALEIIRQAKKSGANAIKLQTYKAETITLKSNKPYFLLDDNKWGESKTLWDLYKEAHTPWEWHKKLFEEAKNIGIEIFSSPFDESAVELLEKLKCPAYKVASPEINHIPLLEHLAETKKPIILSSGVAKLSDIELAIDTLRTKGVKDIILLKCNTSYPAPIEESNLLTIMDIKKRFNVLSGLSDHTIGNVCAISSVALGASFIEKHFNLADNLSTVDSFFSANSVEFKKLVDDVRLAESAIGKVDYKLSKSAALQTSNMRSIFAAMDIKAGEKLTHLNIKVVRPGQGLHPKHFKKIIGKTVKSDIFEGEPLIWPVIN
jgi:pseudaminic acid synthase